MQVKSLPTQQYAVGEVWTVDFSVLVQALYHRANLPYNEAEQCDKINYKEKRC